MDLSLLLICLSVGSKTILLSFDCDDILRFRLLIGDWQEVVKSLTTVSVVALRFLLLFGDCVLLAETWASGLEVTTRFLFLVGDWEEVRDF